MNENSHTHKFDLLLTKECQLSKTQVHSVVFTYSSQAIVVSKVASMSFKAEWKVCTSQA